MANDDCTGVSFTSLTMSFRDAFAHIHLQYSWLGPLCNINLLNGLCSAMRLKVCLVQLSFLDTKQVQNKIYSKWCVHISSLHMACIPCLLVHVHVCLCGSVTLFGSWLQRHVVDTSNWHKRVYGLCNIPMSPETTI